MKPIKNLWLIIVFNILNMSVHSQNYITSAEVVSNGGGKTLGGNYSNFGVIGEVFVKNSVSGGNYTTSMGFLYASDIFTGVEDFHFSESNIIYPNPFNDIIHFRVNSCLPSRIDIYTLLGLRIKCSEFVYSLNLSDLPSGVYVINVFNEFGSIIFKEKMVKIE